MINNVLSIFKNNVKDKHFGEILTGSIISFAAKILAVFLGFIFNWIVSIYYGAEAMGMLALINAFFAFTLIPALMGTRTSILRFIPEHLKKYSKESAYNVYLKILWLVLISSIIVSLLTLFNASLITQYLFHDTDVTYLIVIASLLIAVQSASSINIAAIRALKHIKLFSLFQLVSPAINIVLLLFLTYFYFDDYNPVYTIFYSSGLLLLMSWYIMKRLFTGSYKSRHNQSNVIHDVTYTNLVAISFPMFLTGIMGVLITQTDVVMLGMMSTTLEVGIYTIAVKFALLTSFILTSINTIVAPKFSELYYSDNIESLKIVARKTSKMIFWSTLPIMIVIWVFGKILLGIFGEEFIVGYTALVLLTLGQFVNSISGSVGYFLNMTGFQKIYNYIMIFSAMVNIVLNIILIPLYSIEGAALASMISIVLSNLLALLFIKYKFGFYMGYIPMSYMKG